MKKILIFFISICALYLPANAANIKFNEIPGNFFQENGVYMGKKIIDESILSTYSISNFQNILSLQSDYYPRTDDLKDLYNSIYYPISINGDNEIKTIKDYNGINLNFTQSGNLVKIYYQTF